MPPQVEAAHEYATAPASEETTSASATDVGIGNGLPTSSKKLLPMTLPTSRTSASATTHRHRQREEERPSATTAASKGTRAAAAQWGTREVAGVVLPDWDAIALLARFWTHYPSTRYPRLRNFLLNAVTCGEQYHAPNSCGDAEEWVNLVFSSAALKAARRRLGHEQPAPMNHFGWHVSRTQRRQLDPHASVNLGVLERLLDELGEPLDDLLEHGEPEDPELDVQPLHDRLRALDFFLERWSRTAPRQAPPPPAAALPPGPTKIVVELDRALLRVTPETTADPCDRERVRTLLEFFKTLGVPDQLALDERAAARARAELGSNASAHRLRLRALDWRYLLLEELHPNVSKVSA